MSYRANARRHHRDPESAASDSDSRVSLSNVNERKRAGRRVKRLVSEGVHASASVCILQFGCIRLTAEQEPEDPIGS